MVLILNICLYILVGLYAQLLLKPFFVSSLDKLFWGFFPPTVFLAYLTQSSFEEVRTPWGNAPSEPEEMYFRGDPLEGKGASSPPSSALRGEGPTERSTELHAHSAGPAPIVPGEEGNDLMRAVAPFLKGEASQSMQVADQTPQATAYPVSSNDEGGTDGSSDSSDCESDCSSSSYVSMSADESEVEFKPEAAEVISIPQFRMDASEREQRILLKAQHLLSREEVDEEYVQDVVCNLKDSAERGELEYHKQLSFESFEVGLTGKRLEIKDDLLSLFVSDEDPEVVNFKAEEKTDGALRSRLNDDFRDYYAKIYGPIETAYSQESGFREWAENHVDGFHRDLRENGHVAMTYIDFREEVIRKANE